MTTIYQVIEDHTRQNPHSIAIFSTVHQNSLTYQDLWKLINNIHQQLGYLGVTKNHKIALLASANSAETATAILAFSSCATCVVINPQLTERELTEYLSQLSIQMIFYFPEYTYLVNQVANKLNLKPIELIREPNSVGKFNLAIEEEKHFQQNNFTQENDLALIFATSGTTGRSKLVPLTHKSLYYCCENTAKILQLSEQDICLNMIPLYHVHGIVTNFFLPLFSGGKVCLNGDFNPDLFLDWLTESQATWYSVSPPIHQIILNIIQEKGLENRQIHLRFIRSGAASLSSQIITALEQLLNIPLIEAYGMTEIPNLTSNRLELRKLNSVGKTIGSEIAIIDELGNFLPQGEIGEVIVKGENVISSYLNNDEVSQNSFINGWFRTGDLGYLDEDSYLFLQGRIKEIINRGGNQIAPQEIDNLLLQLPQIKEAVTFPIPHKSLGEDLVSAVVLHKDLYISPPNIREYLSKLLAEFKIPSQIILVPEIPKGTTGKVQRFKLADVLKTYYYQPRNYAPPITKNQKLLVEIWTEVMGETIGIYDNFFERGVDSIRAMMIINRLEQKTGKNLQIHLVFNYPTIAEICQFLEKENQIANQKLREVKIKELKTLIKPFPPLININKKKNPPAIFILSSCRSGSTLLRIMLGGNSKLFAPPELHLLHFNNMADRAMYFLASQWTKSLLEGNIRAVMKFMSCDVEKAKNMVADLEKQQMSIQDYYKFIQESIGNKILVDKTPNYAIRAETLKRAESYFQDCIYIHLIRHPLGMIRSFEEAQIEQIYNFFLFGNYRGRIRDLGLNNKQFGDFIWYLSNQNIINFLKTIPPERQYCLKFENLVNFPEISMQELCKFLNLDFSRNMVKPYENKPAKMTDGIYRDSRMIGDIKFNKFNSIKSEVARQWENYYQEDFCSDLTWELAHIFQYEKPILGNNDVTSTVSKSEKLSPEEVAKLLNMETGEI
jgi:acyl-CoA synthetase (AMP-forming)/AMP-acid ligase II/acyl carrier protein